MKKAAIQTTNRTVRGGCHVTWLFLVLRTGNSLKRLLQGKTEAFRAAKVLQYRNLEEERKPHFLFNRVGRNMTSILQECGHSTIYFHHELKWA